MVPDELSPYSVTDLMDFEKLPFDIYLRLPSGRLVKVGKKGQAVLQESLERYAAKGVDHVLVETSELTRPEEEPPQQMEADPSTPPPPQLVALMEQSRGIYQNLHLLGFQASALKEANQVAEKGHQGRVDLLKDQGRPAANQTETSLHVDGFKES